MGNNKYDPPEQTAGDAAHAVVRSALSAIPVGGGSAVELFNWLVIPPIERRRHTWMQDVANGLRDLEKAKRVNLDELRDDDGFVDVVLHASQAALRTSQADKRKALRNAIFNAAARQAPDVAEQQVFISMVDEFTEWHLRLLKLFQNPRAHVRPTALGAALATIVEHTFPELRGRRDFYDQIWQELNNRGLVNTPSIHSMMTESGLTAKRTTDRGDRFLAFITTPMAEGANL